MTQVETSGLDRLRAVVVGTVAVSDEPGFADAVNIWNGAISRRPSVVVRAVTGTDVSAALSFARDHGLEVSVRGVGTGLPALPSPTVA